MAPKSKKDAAVVEKKEEAVEEKKDDKVEEPAAKKAKAEEVPKKEEAVEKEEDAKPDTRPKMKGPITFETAETTLNVVPTMGGNILMTLSEGGMQYLLAGARANTALKTGRYLFETQIVEYLHPSDQKGRGKPPYPRQLVRVGFSTEGSALVLGAESDGCVFFDSEGSFTDGSPGKKKCQRFSRGEVVGLLLNLDPKSPNANTVSLFKGGKRASEPYPLPEALQGKPLFPHVAFRNVSLQVHFGPQPLQPLPFTCTSLQSAAAADVVASKVVAPKDGKYEVMFPVGFPDEGTFEWLDNFLKDHPNYVELSERSLIKWAVQSGFQGGNKFKCNDRPEVYFGVPAMDDQNWRRIVNSIASVRPRNYVVMEVKQNLLAADREHNLKRFPRSLFKRTAVVAMGEPPNAFKKLVQDKILKVKQMKVDSEYRLRIAAKQRKKELAKKAAEAKKRQEEYKKKMEETRKAKEEADAAKKAAEKKDGEEKKEGEEEKKEGEEVKKDEEKKEEAKAEPVKEDEKKEEEAESEDEAPPGPVTLSEEEQKVFFNKPIVGDLSQQDVERSFGKFTIPQKSEGFDEVKYDWQDAKKSEAYLRTWVLEKKKTTKAVFSIGEWFKTQEKDWQKQFKDWQETQKNFKPAEKKADDEDEEATNTDIFSLENVSDVGNGEPLFQNFSWEDWALMNLRWELYTFMTAFKKDVDDPDYEAIPEDNVPFYYNKYHRKNLTPKLFGKETLTELVTQLKDTFSMTDKKTLATSIAEGATFDIFVKHAEEARRERQRRIDAGDESVRLKLSETLDPSKPQPQSQREYYRATRSEGGADEGKGKSKGGGKSKRR